MARPGERRRREETERRDDTLTRRVFLARGAVFTGFLALGGKLWQMQIADGEAHRRVAEGNTLSFENIDAPRGRIVDRNGEPLAISRRAWTVSIVPSRLPQDIEQRRQVLDSVASTLGLKEALVLDRTLVPVGSEAAVVNSLATRMQVDAEYLLGRLLQDDAALELLQDNLEPQDAEALRASLSDIPGVRVLNTIDYHLVKHSADDAPMIVKKDVEPEQALYIGANQLYLPGVVVDDRTLLRQYPAGPGFAHILGYVGPITAEEYEAAQKLEEETNVRVYRPQDKVGRGGIEEALEEQLRGAKGGRWVQVDADGVERYELLDRRLDETPGLSVQLTIDKKFQDIVVQKLQDGIRVANDEAIKLNREPVGAGVAIAMDPRNGEILAMVSLPSFDNQAFADGISDELYNHYLDEDGDDKPAFEPLLDRAISGLFPPGSTIKPLFAAAGLEDEKIPFERKIVCKGRIRVPHSWDESQGNDYPCWERDQGHGEVDVLKGIAQSCDVFFYNVGAPYDKPEGDGTNTLDYLHYYNPGETTKQYFAGMGIETMERYLREAFGFGIRSGIELAGEEPGLVPNPNWLFQSELNQNWSVGDTINVSIGQGHLLCTPLQLLNGTAAIVNGGTLWKPRIVKAQVREDGTVVKETQPQKLVPKPMDADKGLATIKPEHLETVREGMRRTVTEGTALGKIDVPGITIGAKSGTAEYGVAVDGKYAQGHAWFTAYGPHENPEIVVAVVVVGGGPGSQFAGPVANAILNAYFHEPGIRRA